MKEKELKKCSRKRGKKSHAFSDHGSVRAFPGPERKAQGHRDHDFARPGQLECRVCAESAVVGIGGVQREGAFGAEPRHAQSDRKVLVASDGLSIFREAGKQSLAGGCGQETVFEGCAVDSEEILHRQSHVQRGGVFFN